MLRDSTTTATTIFVLVAALFFSLSLAGIAGAQSNTSLGTGALVSNTTGSNNTALGFNALFSNNTGSNNTAIGVDSLVFNTTGSNMVRQKPVNLLRHECGQLGGVIIFFNTAAGVNALFSNTTGGNNTALGLQHAPFQHYGVQQHRHRT